MLRRTRCSAIAAYDFGHPDMVSNFSKEVYQQPKPLLAGPVQKTKLNNGMTVVSQDLKGQLSSIGFFVEAGAKFDPLNAPGLSYVMRWAALTSNMDDSLFQVDRALRSVGASYGHTEVNKRYLGWVSEVPRQAWKVPLERMQGCFAVPRFAESDIERFRDTMDNLLEEQRWQSPREYVANQVESVAFFREPLGSPRHVQPEGNDNCSSEKLLAQYCKYMSPQRFTIAAINVDHSELLGHYATLPLQLSSLAPHFSQALLEPSKPDETEAGQYLGLREGFKIEHRTKEMGTHPDMVEDGTVAIAWLTYGADKSAKEYATALVARELFNGLTQDSVRTDRTQAHHGLRTFYKPYSSAGLIGITARNNVTGGGVKKEVTEAFRVFASLASKSANAKDVARAGQRAQVAFLSDNVENQRDYLAHLATSTFDADTVTKAIGAVTVDDVNTAFAAMKTAKPVWYGTGMVNDLPTLRSLWLNLKL